LKQTNGRQPIIRLLLGLGIGLAALGSFSAWRAATLYGDQPPPTTPAAALARLKAGNERFVRGHSEERHLVQVRTELLTEQRPYAIILSCSDSRVPPELVFDETLGRLFIIRVAGNVIDPVALGSIEYGAQVLGARLLVVLGHEHCGAVKAAAKAGSFGPNIDAIVKRIAPAIERVKAGGVKRSGHVEAEVEENVRVQLRSALEESAILRDLTQKGRLQSAGGVYDLETGRVLFLSDEGDQPR
jgi:carbonic anhydrase